MGLIDKVRIPVQIDLGFSDEVFPLPSLVSFPTILDFPSPSVFAYNVETSLSEKVEAIYYHGEINTRMNDFFDIWMISNRFSLEGELLVKAMKLTFETRDTRIERSLVEIFTEEYIASKLDLWKAYLKTIGYYSGDAGNDAYSSGAARGGYQTYVSDDFEVILERIVEFIQPPLDAVSSKNPFNLMWNPIKGWT